MSSTNLFIVKNDIKLAGLESCSLPWAQHVLTNGIAVLENCSSALVKLALDRGIGIHFNLRGYHDELLNLLKVKFDYFTISDSFYHTETDDLFSQIDTYEQVKCLDKKNSHIKERELLLVKYEFFNKIIAILFQQPNVREIEFYVSDQYSSLNDYNTAVEVKDRNLTEAFVNRLEPTKQEPSFGLKTTKFIIK